MRQTFFIPTSDEDLWCILYSKAWRKAKIEAGYRRRKDPVTGKERWVFVGK